MSIQSLTDEILRLFGLEGRKIRRAMIILEPGRAPRIEIDEEVRRLGKPGVLMQGRKFDLIPHDRAVGQPPAKIENLDLVGKVEIQHFGAVLTTRYLSPDEARAITGGRASLPKRG